ncbi:hypothetical protein HDE69_000541 [Pedobacter cryoconitis]|uniref:Uncharacterized protein n=1 Tax=Pedobacter cryoconitis TaxID=188932 RepID=A0A7W8YPP1_9SPHI|nr:hypothetical protein [Pedobacter cryoconitis]MBB5619505.1 hypothetical protein [Pedobacter cryoconitis]MBB5644795.1 hypothetical protein [Pedobacter cryoconitis]
MNLNATTIAILLVVILAIPYLVHVIRKVQNYSIPLIKALNPFYTKEMHEADQLKLSLSPILKEMETQELAKFIKHWTAKFENGSLTEQDVTDLNARIADGRTDQVNGILALHPAARAQFQEINAQLKLKEAGVEQEASTEVLA